MDSPMMSGKSFANDKLVRPYKLGTPLISLKALGDGTVVVSTAGEGYALRARWAKSEMLELGAFRRPGILRCRAIACCHALAITIFAITIAGCGQDSNSSREPAESSSPLLSIDPTTVGSITGTVTIEGSATAMEPIVAPCSKTNSPGVVSPSAIDEHNSELANTVIYLKAGLANYRYDTPKDHAVLDQRDCTYVPHVIALMTNEPLEIRNNDPVAHNIHVLAKVNKQWDHSEPAGVAPIIESFPKPELAVHVICKIHIGMSAFLFIFDNPYYAVTSSRGVFELKNVPPGTYTVEAWREHFGTQDQTVTIGPKESKAVSFVFKAGNS
jgi:hypothetical protein